MTTDTKEASQSVSSESKKNQKTNNDADGKLYHIYRVCIDVDSPDAMEARSRLNREMLAMLILVQKDYSCLTFDSKVEISSEYMNMETV